MTITIIIIIMTIIIIIIMTITSHPPVVPTRNTHSTAYKHLKDLSYRDELCGKRLGHLYT
jgi:hypothetical protein